MVGRRCIVEGRVQGVWFRDTTRRKARELGIKGHALNLPDGRVEVLACGPEDRVQDLADWLWQGSAMSKVSNVSCDAIALDQVPTDFRIG